MSNILVLISLALVGICWGFPRPNDERILGGTEASLEEFPYMINMYYNGRFRCGGSILTAKTILTAAHCTAGTVTSGTTINAGSLKLGEGVTHSVSRTIQHKDYNSYYLTNDISLLILAQALEFSPIIQPIEFDRSYIDGGNKAISTGWGMTTYPGNASPVLLYLNVVTVKQSTCKDMMSPSNIFPDHLCAYSGVAGKGVCRGDSGGPLALNGKVIGIASWVKAYCAVGAPDVYARVSVFSDWLDQHIV